MIFSIGGGGERTDIDRDTRGKKEEQERRGSLESQTRTGITGGRGEESAFAFDRTAQLDEATLATLRGLTGQAGGAAEQGIRSARGLDRYGRALSRRAEGTQEFYDALAGDVTAAAQARGESRAARRATNLAQAGGGSTLNTLVQRGIERDAIQLDTELAALGANIGIQGREAETQALMQAGNLRAVTPQLLSQPLTNITSLLRGAETTRQQVSGAQQQQTQLSLEDVISALGGQRDLLSEFEERMRGDEESGRVGFEFGI